MIAFDSSAFSVAAFGPDAFAFGEGIPVLPAPNFTSGGMASRMASRHSGRRVRPRTLRDDDLIWSGAKR